MRRLLTLAVLLAGLAGCRNAPAPPAGVRADDVTFATAQGQARAVEFVPPGEPRAPVLVLHGDYGLNDVIRGHARRLAEGGHLVLALDLYDGKVAQDVEEAHILSRALPEGRVNACLKAAVDRLAERSGGRGVGVIGWDVGGGYALDLAVADPRVAACVCCYGRLTTDPQLLRKLKAPVLGIFGASDEGIPAETRDAFVRAMKEAGRPAPELFVAQGCDGGFMTPPPGHKPAAGDEAAAGRAWERVEAFFRDALR